LNKDGYLDIVIDCYDRGTTAIYWGSESGYNPSNITFLPNNWAVHNIEVGDVNKDNWLDICLPNVNGGTNYIYWVSSNGYSPSNCSYLPCEPGIAQGLSVADLDKNEYLDLVFTGFNNMNVSYIYWGSNSGFNTRDTLFTGPCFGGSSIADFNQDGSLDIFCNSHTNFSYFFWVPSFTTNTALPVSYDHYGMFREIGNVYNRKYYEDYISSVFDAGEEVNWGIIYWDDSLPSGTSIHFFVRSGDTPNPDNSWSIWDSLGKGEEIPDSLNSRYLQYQARLKYTNPAYLPYLYEVRIDYGPSTRLILEPNYADSTLPAYRIDYNIRVMNMGIGLDTVDLRYQHNTNWQIGLFDSTGMNPLIDHNNNSIPDVIININDTILIVLSVIPPGNAQGGEVDSLRHIGNSNINPLLVDTAYIATRIRRVVGILVEPDQVGYTIAGVPKSYDLWVYNQGTNRDTVDLYYQHNKPWGIVLLDSSGLPLTDHNNNGFVDLWVSSLDSTRFRLVVYSQDTASNGVADILILMGRSTLNPVVRDSVRVITIIWGMGSIIIFPDQNANGLPGNWVNFLITARNNQNFVDTIDLRYIDRLGYSYQFLDSTNNPLTDHNNNCLVDLPGIGSSGGEIDFNLRVLVPSNIPAGTGDTIFVYGYSGRDTVLRDSSINILTVGTFAQVRIEPNQGDSGAVGDSIDYLLWSENLGNASDVIDLVVINGAFGYSLRDKDGNLLIDTDGDGMRDLGVVNPFGGCESLLVRVRILQADSGEVDTVVVWIISFVQILVWNMI